MAALRVPSVCLMSALLFLFLFSVTLSAEAPCPRSCNCPKAGEVHCTFRHLTSPPSNLPTDSKRVNLGYNSLRGVAASTFGTLHKLEMLMLHGNDIKSVAPGAFYNLRQLQILKLSYNKLKTIYQGMLEGMTGLVRLHLDHNLIDFIEPLSFNGLTSLKLLQLDGNKLRDLHPYTFVTLSYLGNFWGSSLHHLHIADNELKYLLPGVLRHLSKLESLSIYGNPWTCDCNLSWLLDWNEKHDGIIKCKKDPGDTFNCASCSSPLLLNSSQVFQLSSEELDCKRPSIASPLKTGELSHLEDTEPDLPYIKNFESPLGRLTFTLSDSHENVAHVACDVSQPSDSTSVTWDTLKNSDILVNVTLVSHLVCDIDRDMLHNMWRLIAYYYESPALLDRGAKHENTSQTGFQYSQAVNEDAAYFTDLKGHLTAEPSWLLQPRISLQLNRPKTTTKKLVLNFGTSLTNHMVTYDKVTSSWAVIQRGMATQVQTVVQGSDVSFECEVYGSEQKEIEWMLPDLTLVEKSHSDKFTTEDNKLHINNVTAADSGLYHCLVKTDMDVDTVPFRLAVREKPNQSELNGQKISVESGSVLTLECSVSSPQPSETSWYLPNAEVLTTSQQKGGMYTHKNNTLVITDVNHDDGGIYSCLAVNLYGVDMLSHLVEVTGESMENGEQVDMDENESPLTFTQIENEGSGSEEIEYEFPKQKQTFTGKERGSGSSRSGKGNRGKYNSRMLNTFSQNRERAEKLDNVDAKRPSPAPTTWTTTLASQEDVTSMMTTTVAAKTIAVKTTYTTHLEKQTDKLNPTQQRKTTHQQTEYENDTVTFQSKSEITDTRPEIRTRNRLSKNPNLTPFRRTPNSRRRRPLQRRINGHPHDSKDIATETSINTTSWIKTRNRSQINVDLIEKIINRKQQLDRTHIHYTTPEPPQSHEQTTEDGTLLNKSTTPLEHEYNIYQDRKDVKDTQYEHVSSENINTERSYTKENTLIFKTTTFSPRKHEITITTPLSDIARHVGMSAQPSKNFHGWISLMTNRPEIIQSTPGPITSTYNMINGQTIAPYPAHDPSSSKGKDLLLLKPQITSANGAVLTASAETDVSLPCRAFGSPEPTISWRRVSTGATLQKSVNHGEGSKFEVLHNGTLMIKNLQPDDKGQYMCSAKNIYGTAHTVVTLLVITQAPKIINPPSKDIFVYLGKSVNLHCIALGKPKAQISWILPDQTLLKGVGTYAMASLFSNGTLSIPSVHFSNEGHYKCIASNVAGEDTVTYDISVRASLPAINEDAIESLTISTGSSVFVNCSTKGEPQPVIKWILPDGTTLKPTQISTSKQHVFVFPNGTLYIDRASVTDGGKYECTATNPVGSVKRLLFLNTKQDSYFPKRTEQQHNVSATYGSTVYLHCLYKTTVWRLPSKTLLSHHFSSERSVTAFSNGTLRIQQLTEKHAGIYMCISRKSTGEDIQYFQVEISIKPPKIQNRHLPQISVEHGKKLQMDCVTSGVPKPEVSWKLPDGTVSTIASLSQDNRSRLQHYVIFGNGTLLLKQVNKKDEGDYICYAKNELGEDEMKVSVRVESPTTVSSNQVSVLAQLGKPAYMKCKSHGSPRVVTWLSPGKNVISSTSLHHQILKDGTLMIKKVTLIDEGRYTCFARNSASNSIELEVEYKKPDINGHQGASSTNLTAVSYQTTLMDCKSESKPKAQIIWTTPSGLSLTMPYVGGRFQVHENGSLELRGVRKSDEGLYKCVAKNDLGEASLTVMLLVEALGEKPSFSNPNIEVYPIKSDGSPITLECIATGKPRPAFVWVLPNNTQLTPGTQLHRFSHFTGNGILQIISPMTTDKGIYRCLAKNVAGQAEKRYELQTGRKPYIRGSGGPVKITFGNVLNMPCPVDGWPEARVAWVLPNGMTLVKPQATGRISFLPNNTLQIKDVAKFDKGAYTCKATNIYGSTYLPYSVTVMVYPPQITTAVPSILRVHRGAFVSMDCIATGIPKPDISWTLPGRTTLLPSSRFTAKSGIHMTEEGSLVIPNPGLMHSGIYKCNAKNLLGTDFKSTYLQVV